jgi:hypothetical protein
VTSYLDMHGPLADAETVGDEFGERNVSPVISLIVDGVEKEFQIEDPDSDNPIVRFGPGPDDWIGVADLVEWATENNVSDLFLGLRDGHPPCPTCDGYGTIVVRDEDDSVDEENDDD